MLDTNTVSYYFRGIPSVVARLLATRPNEIALSAIVVYELHTGLLRLPAGARRPRMDALAAFIGAIEVLPFGVAAAQESANIAARLFRRGQPIGPIDVLIAGAARSAGAILVTRNVREFSKVEGLQIENWHDEQA